MSVDVAERFSLPSTTPTVTEGDMDDVLGSSEERSQSPKNFTKSRNLISDDDDDEEEGQGKLSPSSRSGGKKKNKRLILSDDSEDDDEMSKSPPPVVDHEEEELLDMDIDEEMNKRNKGRSRIRIQESDEGTRSSAALSPSPSRDPPSDVDNDLLDIPPTVYNKSKSTKTKSKPNNSLSQAFPSLSLDPDVYGNESSDDEKRSLHSFHSGSDNDNNSSNHKSYSKSKSSKPKKEKKPRKASEKARAKTLQELSSKTQKMARESRVSLPYHVPKQLTLDEFLKKRNRAKAPLLTSLVKSGALGSAVSMEEDVLPILAEVEKDNEEILKKKIQVAIEPLNLDFEESPKRDSAIPEMEDSCEDENVKKDVLDWVEAIGAVPAAVEENSIGDEPSPPLNDIIENKLPEPETIVEKEMGEQEKVETVEHGTVEDNKIADNEIPKDKDPPAPVNIPTEEAEKVEDLSIIENFQEKEAELNAFLEETKPKPKKLTIKERLMMMPGYKDIAKLKPKIGGTERDPKAVIDLDENLKKTKSRNQKGVDDLMTRFANQICANAGGGDNSKPKHYKIHVNKVEADSEGILHSVVDEIDYVNGPETEEDDDILAKVNPPGSSSREQVPGEKMFRLKKALKESIKAKKTKEYNERLKIHAMYNEEKELEDKMEEDGLPDDEILEEEDEIALSSDEEEEEDDEELLADEDDEEDEEIDEKTEKKRKRLIFLDDEAEDEDEEERMAASNDEEEEEEQDSQSQVFEVSNQMDDFPQTIIETSQKEQSSNRDNGISSNIAELLEKTGTKVDSEEMSLTDLCSGSFPSQAPSNPVESQCFGFDIDDEDDDELLQMTADLEQSQIVKELEESQCTPPQQIMNIGTPQQENHNKPPCGDDGTPKIIYRVVKSRSLGRQFELEAKRMLEEKEIVEITETPKAHQIIASQESDDEEEFVIGKKPKPKKKKRLQFSDDEDDEADDNDNIPNEDEDASQAASEEVIADEEGESQNQHGQQWEVDEAEDDDEEAEYERQLLHEKKLAAESKPKGLFGKDGKLRKKFVEDEAELSGSEEGSDDEDERGLNFYEKEDGDDEELNEEDVRKQVERAHLKHLLDKDDEEIKELQTKLLERGDLGEVKQRERKFRWSNVDDEWADDHARMGVDSDGECDETEEDVQKRLADIERRKWITENSEMLEANEEESQKLIFEKSRFLKLGKTTMHKIESFVEHSSSFVLNESSNSVPNFSIASLVKSKIKTTSKSFLNSHKDEEDEVKLCRSSTSQPMFASPDEPASKFKRGSFLSRGSPSLSHLAEFAKMNDTTKSNVKSNSRNFVFSVVTPPDQTSKQNKAVKRPANSQGTQPKKLVKIDRAFSNLDESSKDASIFKWM